MCYNINELKERVQKNYKKKKEVFIMKKNYTKKEMFTKLLSLAEVQADREMTEFLTHEIEMNEKRNSSKSKKVDREQERTKNEIYEILKTKTEPTRVSTLVVDMNNKYSSNKIVAMLNKLINDNKVVRTETKGIAYFEVMPTEE